MTRWKKNPLAAVTHHQGRGNRHLRVHDRKLMRASQCAVTVLSQLDSERFSVFAGDLSARMLLCAHLRPTMAHHRTAAIHMLRLAERDSSKTSWNSSLLLPFQPSESQTCKYRAAIYSAWNNYAYVYDGVSNCAVPGDKCMRLPRQCFRIHWSPQRPGRRFLLPFCFRPSADTLYVTLFTDVILHTGKCK